MGDIQITSSDYCNLVEILNNAEGSRLYGVEVTGYIKRSINGIPKNLEYTEIDPNCKLIEVNMLCIRFPKKDPNTVNRQEKNIYMVHGDMLLFVDKTVQENDWLTFKGNIALGDYRNNRYYTVMHTFKKGTKGWKVVPTVTEDVNLANMYKKVTADKTKLYPVYKYLKASVSENKVIYPLEVLQLEKCSSTFPIIYFEQLKEKAEEILKEVEQQKEKEPEPIVENTPLQSSKAKIEDRLKPVERSKVYEKLQNEMEDILEKREEGIISLKDRLEIRKDDCHTEEDFHNGITLYVRYMLTSMLQNWEHKVVSNQGSTGRALFMSYLDTNDEVKNMYEPMGVTLKEFFMANAFEIMDNLLKGEFTLHVEGESNIELAKELFGDKEVFYAGILSRILGVSADILTSSARECTENNILFSKLVNERPYNLLTLSGSIGFADLEKVALATGKAVNQQYMMHRYLGLIYDYTLKGGQDGRTIYPESEILQGRYGMQLTTQEYTKLTQTGTTLPMDRVSDINTYVNKAIGIQDLQYKAMDFKKYGNKYIQMINGARLKKALDIFLNSGFGYRLQIDGKSYIVNSVLMAKELYVYDKLQTLASKSTEYDHDEIDRLVDEFERNKANELGIDVFKLEDKQREACHLVGQGVFLVTGPAGGGKTTVAECIIYVREQLAKKKKRELKVEFATPTGKASKRLQEVIGRPVKTMHSRFCIFGDTNNIEYIKDRDFNLPGGEPDMFVFDEVAMANIDLIFNVISKIKNSQICFLGDINQLAPIGKGLPFRNMLMNLPCVTLNVCKRSAEGSNVTRNSKRINEKSEPHNFEVLDNSIDYRSIACGDDTIPLVIGDIVKYYLGQTQREYVEGNYFGTQDTYMADLKEQLTPDDIQVVSPVGKPTFKWGTAQLNKMLQNIFVPQGTAQSIKVITGNIKNAKEYRVGDRVIHTDNTYVMQHFNVVGNTAYKKWGFAVMNGDMGYITGFYKATDLEIKNPIEPKPDDWKERLGNKVLRDESDFKYEDSYFMVVQYTDCDGQPFQILYRMNLREELSNMYERYYSNPDLQKIDLAYALTVHKMQGSQAKLIIFALGNFKSPTFLTRNLVYTAITRASKGCISVGDVSEVMESSINQARLCVAHTDVPTLGELVI